MLYFSWVLSNRYADLAWWKLGGMTSSGSKIFTTGVTTPPYVSSGTCSYLFISSEHWLYKQGEKQEINHTFWLLNWTCLSLQCHTHFCKSKLQWIEYGFRLFIELCCKEYWVIKQWSFLLEYVSFMAKKNLFWKMQRIVRGEERRCGLPTFWGP